MPDDVTAAEESIRELIIALRLTVEKNDLSIREIIAVNDRRYEERFQSSQVALTTALANQDKQTLTALTAVKDAGVAALAAADRAVAKAEIASEKRFDGVNEFRETLADQQRTLMPRAEVELMVGQLREQITGLTRQETARQGERTGAKDQMGWFVAIVAVAAAIVGIGLHIGGIH